MAYRYALKTCTIIFNLLKTQEYMELFRTGELRLQSLYLARTSRQLEFLPVFFFLFMSVAPFWRISHTSCPPDNIVTSTGNAGKFL